MPKAHTFRNQTELVGANLLYLSSSRDKETQNILTKPGVLSSNLLSSQNFIHALKLESIRQVLEHFQNFLSASPDYLLGTHSIRWVKLSNLCTYIFLYFEIL